MIKKFEIAYVIVKVEMPLVKYHALIELEEKLGVELGTNYCSDKQCAVFIDCIGEELGSQLQNDLSRAKFLSVLTDGSTDASIIKKEAIFVRYFDYRESGSICEIFRCEPSKPNKGKSVPCIC